MLNLMIIHLVGLLSPGPDFFYVSRISVMSSRREAIGGNDANYSRYCDDAWWVVFSLSRYKNGKSEN